MRLSYALVLLFLVAGCDTATEPQRTLLSGDYVGALGTQSMKLQLFESYGDGDMWGFAVRTAGEEVTSYHVRGQRGNTALALQLLYVNPPLGTDQTYAEFAGSATEDALTVSGRLTGTDFPNGLNVTFRYQP